MCVCVRARVWCVVCRVVNSLYVGEDPNASGCGNNWARGYYTEGAELSESLLELTRKEAERTDAMGSIVLYHAASGGTGGGAGSAVLARLRDQYPEVHLATCTVLPSFKYNPRRPTPSTRSQRVPPDDSHPCAFAPIQRGHLNRAGSPYGDVCTGPPGTGDFVGPCFS